MAGTGGEAGAEVGLVDPSVGARRQAQHLYDSGTPVPKIARTFKAAPATIYRYITPRALK